MFNTIKKRLSRDLIEMKELANDGARFLKSPNIGSAVSFGIAIRQTSRALKRKDILDGYLRFGLAPYIECLFEEALPLLRETEEVVTVFSTDSAKVEYFKGADIFYVNILLKNFSERISQTYGESSIYARTHKSVTEVYRDIVSAILTRFNTITFQRDDSGDSRRSCSPSPSSEPIEFIPSDLGHKLFDDLISSPRRNLMLYGRPGSGKSTIARHILHLMEASGKRVLQFREGSAKPDINIFCHLSRLGDIDAIFIDDIEKHYQLMSTTDFDMLNRHVPHIIATANNPEKMDMALLRPGRFDMLVKHDTSPEGVARNMIGDDFDSLSEELQRRLAEEFTVAELVELISLKGRGLTLESGVQALDDRAVLIGELRAKRDKD